LLTGAALLPNSSAYGFDALFRGTLKCSVKIRRKGAENVRIKEV
jgi:hypothetical protein